MYQTLQTHQTNSIPTKSTCHICKPLHRHQTVNNTTHLVTHRHPPFTFIALTQSCQTCSKCMHTVVSRQERKREHNAVRCFMLRSLGWTLASLAHPITVSTSVHASSGAASALMTHDTLGSQHTQQVVIVRHVLACCCLCKSLQALPVSNSSTWLLSAALLIRPDAYNSRNLATQILAC